MSLFSLSRFFLYATVFFVAVMSTGTLFPFIVGKYVWFRTATALALIAFLLGLIFEHDSEKYLNRIKSLFRSPLVLAVSAFTFAFLLACLFGVDPSFSFWSNFERGEGGLQILHLYIFFLLLITLFKEEKNWRIILWCALAAALLMILYGVFAGLGREGYIGPKFGETGFRFQGSIGNPAYVATYLIFILFYSLYLWVSRYARSWKNPLSYVLILANLVFLGFFVAAATRGAIIGFLGAVTMFLLYLGFAKKEWRKLAIILAILAVLTYGTLVYYKESNFVKNLPLSRIFDISLTTQTFEDRADIWKMAWDGWKERPILGWGPENFLHVFDRHFNPDYFVPQEGFGAWFDRAHSFIFDYLAETGLLGFLAFVSIFGAFYFLFFKHHTRGKGRVEELLVDGLFFMLPIAYLIQALVLFDVLVIYVNLFLFWAFAVYHLENRKLQASHV